MELEPVNTRIQETVPEELYHKLVAQIEKDFILTGIISQILTLFFLLLLFRSLIKQKIF